MHPRFGLAPLCLTWTNKFKVHIMNYSTHKSMDCDHALKPHMDYGTYYSFTIKVHNI